MSLTDDFHVYDTTLRDGSQREGLSLSVNDKLTIARHLDDLGVGFIEGGWPGANPKDAEFFRRARTELTLPSTIEMSLCTPRPIFVSGARISYLVPLVGPSLMTSSVASNGAAGGGGGGGAGSGSGAAAGTASSTFKTSA